MAAILRDSAFYASAFTSKFIQRADRLGGRVVPLPFEVTFAAPETIADTWNCTVIPGNARVVGLDCVAATANSGTLTWQLGDAGNAARYMAATVFSAINTVGTLAGAGAGFTPTADTIVFGTVGVAAATDAAKIVGCIYVVPAA